MSVDLEAGIERVLGGCKVICRKWNAICLKCGNSHQGWKSERPPVKTVICTCGLELEWYDSENGTLSIFEEEMI